MAPEATQEKSEEGGNRLVLQRLLRSILLRGPAMRTGLSRLMNLFSATATKIPLPLSFLLYIG